MTTATMPITKRAVYVALAAPSMRPGAMTAFQLPSVVNGKAHPRVAPRCILAK
jgi:hypothetical protein